MERRDGQNRNVVHADGVQRHRRRRRHAPRIPDHRDRKYGLQAHGNRYPDGGRRHAGDAPGRADGVYPDAEVTVDPKQIEFNADEIVPVDVSFTTNMGDVYAVSRDEDADWISWEDLGGNVIRFTAAPWDDEEQPRTANVYITVGSGETSAATAKIPVTQLAKDLYCYVWGASLFDYDRFELARRMTKSETASTVSTPISLPEMHPKSASTPCWRADYYPAYALAADGGSSRSIRRRMRFPRGLRSTSTACVR